MTHKIFVFLLLLVCSLSFYAQEKDPVQDYMHCVYDSCDDQGEEIMTALDDYEKLLVKEGIFNAASGLGYVAFFESMAANNKFDFKPSLSFGDIVQGVNNQPKEGFKDCQAQVTNKYPNVLDKLQRIAEASDPFMLEEEFTPTSFAQLVLEELSENEFEMDFYRVGILMMIETMSFSLGIDDLEEMPPPPPSPDDVDTLNVFTVLLNYRNRLYVGEDQETLKDISELTYAFVSEYKSRSAIVLKYDRRANYDKFVELKMIVTEAISAVRQDFSIKEYGVSFDQLKEDQKAKVEYWIPVRIVEKELE